jgi:hypothetical protein
VTKPAKVEGISALPEVAEVDSSDDPGGGITFDEEIV